MDIAYRLIELGAEVVAYEPYKLDAEFPKITMAQSLGVALSGADGLALLVGHAPLRDLVPEQVAVQTKARIALDAVNGWNPAEWEETGFRLIRLGVGADN